MAYSAKPTKKHVPIGKFFLESGKITAQQLDHALRYKQEHGCKLGQALVASGFVSEEDLLQALRSQGKVQCIVLTPGIVDPHVASNLGEIDARRFRCLPVNRIADHTTVAMEDPSDVYAIDELAMRLRTRVVPVYAEPKRIREITDFIFKKEAIRISDTSDLSVAKLAERAHQEELVGSLPERAEVTMEEVVEPVVEQEEDLDQPIINMVRSVLQDAFLKGASDVHIEPRREDVSIRLRVDGTLFERATVPKSWARPLLARIKVLANLDIAQRRLPQDGRTQFLFKGNRVDLRVATTPTMQGEGAVLRILDGGRELRNLSDFDMSPQQLEAIQRIITCRHGFVLATGPTGSGKTTTLYAIMQRFVGPHTKIITLEDPVENEMEGVTQINANPKIGLNFARGLRSILRQDPDVVLVGEIRDEETAQIAVQASMTGHIVLSTLHTVGAPETITRLVDMGTEAYLVADTLRGVVAQRLLRRVCVSCRRQVPPDTLLYERLGLLAGQAAFYEGAGCEECNGTGYKGRVGIYEIMELTPELQHLVSQGASSVEIARSVEAMGMTTLRQDGIRKAQEGKTTLQEVLAATSH